MKSCEICERDFLEVLIKYLKTMFPNANIVGGQKYDTFEFEITPIEEKKPVETT